MTQTRTEITYGVSCVFKGREFCFLRLKTQDLIGLSLVICAWCVANSAWQEASLITGIYHQYNTGSIDLEEKQRLLDQLILVKHWQEHRMTVPVRTSARWQPLPLAREDKVETPWWVQ